VTLATKVNCMAITKAIIAQPVINPMIKVGSAEARNEANIRPRSRATKIRATAMAAKKQRRAMISHRSMETERTKKPPVEKHNPAQTANDKPITGRGIKRSPALPLGV
jgi:hypothetical protein